MNALRHVHTCGHQGTAPDIPTAPLGLLASELKCGHLREQRKWSQVNIGSPLHETEIIKKRTQWF